VLAVHSAAKTAVERARCGQGPTLMECMTYRQCGHSRSDPRTYRTKEEEDTWKERDPILRFKQLLLSDFMVSEDELNGQDKSVEKEILEAIHFAENSPEPQPADLYTDVFKE
jgi:TPP-dependent pyruvate/acetoin dehydrogenase alpha subunit